MVYLRWVCICSPLSGNQFWLTWSSSVEKEVNPLLTPEFEMLAGTGDVRALTSSKVHPSCFATRHLCLHGVGGVLLHHFGLLVSETIVHAVANEKLAFIGKPLCPPKHSKCRTPFRWVARTQPHCVSSWTRSSPQWLSTHGGVCSSSSAQCQLICISRRLTCLFRDGCCKSVISASEFKFKLIIIIIAFNSKVFIRAMVRRRKQRQTQM